MFGTIAKNPSENVSGAKCKLKGPNTLHQTNIQNNIDEDIHHLTVEQHQIASRFFNLSKASFKSKATFKDLRDYFSEVKKLAAKVNQDYGKFKSSRIQVDKVSDNYKWSKVAFIYLIKSMIDLDDKLQEWQNSDLITICSKDPLNSTCWDLQKVIATFQVTTRKKINEIENSLLKFYTRTNSAANTEKLNADILYLDVAWETALDPETGREYIYNTLDPYERLFSDFEKAEVYSGTEDRSNGLDPDIEDI